ncbi:S8 family peptidase [Arenicella sp. 4NH20-0111]|uniref:S8 family peptidase n=1 Tax=Arenicella sp. 4NH20-0111 TaxID=3127648 RepID=UPI0033409C8B
MIKNKNALKSSLCGVSLSLLAMSAQAVVLQDDAAASFKTSSSTQANPAFANQLIIKYKDSSYEGQSYALTSDIEKTASNAMGVPMKHLRRMATGAHVMSLPKSKGGAMSKKQLKTLMLQLQSNPSVEYVEIDRMLQAMATPNDPQYANQWHYYETTGGLNTPTAWDTTTGAGVVVAVIDTGITAHPDLDANILPGYDMISSATVANDGNGRDSNPADTGDAVLAGECGTNSPPSNQNSSWHGTHVAGTVAAVGNNNTGVVGVAYGAKVVPIRALGKCGGFTSDIADGIIWAAGGSVSGVPANPNPAKVINLSLGGGGSCDATSQAAINQAVSLGATVVVAAGNSAQNASNATPANCQNVVTVAATNRNGGRANYSNFGNVVDLAAPGGQQSDGISEGVLSTLNTGNNGPASPNYEYYQGTSMATPHVAGAAALMYAVDPTITPAEVESLLKSTSRSFPSSCSGCGTGIVDASAAVAAANPGGGNPGGGQNELTNGTAKTNLSGAQGSQVVYTLDVPAGATDLSFVMSGGSGDADMYVRFGAQPTTSTYDCRPYRNGNNETCDISNVQTGTYYVMLRGYSSYSGTSLVGSFTAGGGSGQPDTISQSNISGAQNQWVDFELDVPAGQSSLVVSISGGSGDADLYVRRGANPTTSTYDCRPYRNGNNETCTISSPAAGTYFIRLRGYRAFSGVTLTAAPQ